jgi:hypothetical protein
MSWTYINMKYNLDINFLKDPSLNIISNAIKKGLGENTRLSRTPSNLILGTKKIVIYLKKKIDCLGNGKVVLSGKKFGGYLKS